MNVSVLVYEPVRSGSEARIVCLKPIVAGSLETGLTQLARTVGALEPPTAANAPAGPAAGEEPWAISGWLSENVPLTSLPVAVADGSATDRVASPAVEITVADVCAVYSLPTPGAKAPNEAAVPMVRESVAGTGPPTSRELTPQTAVWVTVGSLSDVAVRETEPLAAAPVPLVTYTGTLTVSPNLTAVSPLRSLALQPVPVAVAERR